ncbi:MAG: hypothetical protein ACD_37C00640G0008 [uncultured bacterium]|nr:MAG: hypothetical protein ACD_37C00640G0008 [uncultured bacterium]
MVNAAALGFYKCLKRKSIDFRTVVSLLLLHDLANLIKFDIAKGVYLLDKSE